jgi:hypothetical protein
MNILNKSKNKILEVIGEIPTDLEAGSVVSITRNSAEQIYSLGFQPARSIPELPRWFLNKYAPSPFKVLEPFAGGATTLIESIKHGSSVSWFDYHPLSQLLCRVKTTRFNVSELIKQARKVINDSKLQKISAKNTFVSNKEFWFQAPVIEGLEILKDNISNTPAYLRKPLELAFSLTVRKTSNMNDGMILAAKRKNFKETPVFSTLDVYDYFEKYCKNTFDAINQWDGVLVGYKEECIQLDNDYLLGINEGGFYDAVITSPPYINAIDYVWASKFEMHWLDMIKNNSERLELYSNEIGTERIPAAVCKNLGVTGYKNLDQLIEKIYSGEKYKASKGQNELRARVTYKYFMDMKQHFSSISKLIRNGGYYFLSIGNTSSICGVDVPVASILTDLAKESGFEKEFYFHLLLKKRQLNVPRNIVWANNIKYDTMVVLRKN